MSQQSHILDSGWQFRQAGTDKWRSAIVPSCVHLDLLREGLIPDPFYRAHEADVQWIETQDWEYRTAFECDAELLACDGVELEFAGLDTFADVFLNGKLILQAANMFVRERLAVRRHLREGTNELRIYFHSPINRTLPEYRASPYRYPAVNDQSHEQVSVYARKAPYHYGWDWGPRLVTSGIWRPITLHAWRGARWHNVHLTQESVNANATELTAHLDILAAHAGPAQVELKITTPDDVAFSVQVRQQVELQAGVNNLKLPVQIDEPRLWWPHGMGAPHLYDIAATLITDSGATTHTLRYGVRTVEVINLPDDIGESFFLKVNDVPIFIKGANYVPPDSFMPQVSRERYEKIFADATAAHFNMLRVWGGGVYEDDYFYQLADAHGILIWQDFMFACSLYPITDEFAANVAREARDNVRRLRHHAALALWCGNNEIGEAWKRWGWQTDYGYSEADKRALEKGYARIFDEILPQTVNELDAGRFYFPSSPISGWGRAEDFRRGDNHFWGVWHAKWPFEDYRTYVPRFMSEYGFQSFPDLVTTNRFAAPEDFDLFSPVMLAHQKNRRGNSIIKKYLEDWYAPPRDFPAFLYVSQLLQAEGIKIAIEAHRRARPFCMGTLYWQLNDCWPVASWSSVDYYGRWKALHYFVEKAYRPVVIMPDLEGGRVGVYVASDELTPRTARLVVHLQEFTGATQWRYEQTLTVAPAASQLVFDAMLAEIAPPVWDDRTSFLTAVLFDESGAEISSNALYFVRPKDLQLPAPNLRYTVTQLDGAQVQVHLRTENLAKNVYLLCAADADAHFSDNYFDLWPHQERLIEVKTQLDADALARSLSVMTLREAVL